MDMEPDIKKPRYVIRRIKPADFSDAATVLADAMLDDELFSIICPKRREHYSHFRAGVLQRIRTRYWIPGWVLYVAVIEHGDHRKADTIVGYSAWERSGESPEARSWIRENSGWWSCLQAFRCKVSNYISSYFWPDKSSDKAKLAVFLSKAKDNFPVSVFREKWYLGMLAVDPAYHRLGIGTLLTQWGLDQAQAEDVPVGLESSVRGAKLYEKLGFRDFTTVSGLGGHCVPVMVWEPAGLNEKDSYYERAKKEMENRE